MSEKSPTPPSNKNPDNHALFIIVCFIPFSAQNQRATNHGDQQNPLPIVIHLSVLLYPLSPDPGMGLSYTTTPHMHPFI